MCVAYQTFGPIYCCPCKHSPSRPHRQRSRIDEYLPLSDVRFQKLEQVEGLHKRRTSQDSDTGFQRAHGMENEVSRSKMRVIRTMRESGLCVGRLREPGLHLHMYVHVLIGVPMSYCFVHALAQRHMYTRAKTVYEYFWLAHV